MYGVGKNNNKNVKVKQTADDEVSIFVAMEAMKKQAVQKNGDESSSEEEKKPVVSKSLATEAEHN